jgi:Protein of unknown function (DUF2378)
VVSARMTNVKGTAVVAALRFLRERFGEEGLAGVLSDLDPRDLTALEGGGLVSAWYPVSLLLHLMRAAEARFGAQLTQFYRHMGRASADYGLTTVYRIFFKVGSPQFIISRASRVFGSYYSQGQIRTVDSGTGHATVELVDFPDGAPEFCERILGWMERTMELAGAKNLRSAHSLCVHRGDEVCRFEGSWE